MNQSASKCFRKRESKTKTDKISKKRQEDVRKTRMKSHFPENNAIKQDWTKSPTFQKTSFKKTKNIPAFISNCCFLFENMLSLSLLSLCVSEFLFHWFHFLIFSILGRLGCVAVFHLRVSSDTDSVTGIIHSTALHGRCPAGFRGFLNHTQRIQIDAKTCRTWALEDPCSFKMHKGIF